MKILIVGTVGAGKTTLAKKLSKKYNIKYYEIDSIIHDDEDEGRKRTEEEQNIIIKNINDKNDWIIEGVLRKNLRYLLDIADKVIYLDVSKRKRDGRIFVRFLRQKLKLEVANYNPTFGMLKMMYRWSNEYELQRVEFERLLGRYAGKLEVRRE